MLKAFKTKHFEFAHMHGEFFNVKRSPVGIMPMTIKEIDDMIVGLELAKQMFREQKK